MQNETKGIYIFTGLGADERVFKNLHFPAGTVFIEAVPPFSNEKIEDYAERLLPQITSPNPIFIGLSFGGILAVETAKKLQVKKIILIASVKTRNELPLLYRAAGRLNIHRLIPAGILKKSNFFTNWFFGLHTKTDKALLAAVLKDTDTNFLKWAVNELVHWKNETIPSSLIHIHGDNDRLLPAANIKADIIIKNGGHLMILDKADEINAVLKKELP